MTFDLNTVKSHLRIDHDLEDDLLTVYMAAAVDFAVTFLGKPLADFEEVPATVKAGLLLHTAMLYEDREGSFIDKDQQLKTIKLLYYPYRVVTL
ncbi:MAG: head-tail connector protein [Bacillota bacterium]|jgi:uncharacterized phage protein (predicted DNA packaging)